MQGTGYTGTTALKKKANRTRRHIIQQTFGKIKKEQRCKIQTQLQQNYEVNGIRLKTTSNYRDFVSVHRPLKEMDPGLCCLGFVVLFHSRHTQSYTLRNTASGLTTHLVLETCPISYFHILCVCFAHQTSRAVLIQMKNIHTEVPPLKLLFDIG